MKRCQQCNAILLPGASFCHKCGQKTSPDNDIVEEEIAQPKQDLFSQNPAAEINEIDNEPIIDDTVKSEIIIEDFYHLNDENSIELDLNISQHHEPEQPIDNTEKIEEKIENEEIFDLATAKKLFFERLRNRVDNEHNPESYSDYVEQYYRSQFEKTMASRIELLQEEIKRNSSKNIDNQLFIQNTFEHLLNYFIISECADINEIKLSEKILAYDNRLPESWNMEYAIRDFLEVDTLDLPVYRNFISMPKEKLDNAIKSFVAVPREEKLFFIIDSSLTGTCREGFAMSNKALYWKTPLEKAHRIAYNDITSVVRHRDWIEINSLFFNIDKVLNMRLLRLFKMYQLR